MTATTETVNLWVVKKMGVGSTLKAKYSRLYNVTSRYHFLAATPAIDQEVDTIGILCKSSL